MVKPISILIPEQSIELAELDRDFEDEHHSYGSLKPLIDSPSPLYILFIYFSP